MKKIIYRISVAAVALLAAVGLQSCDLDEYNPHGTTADTVFTTPEGIDALVNAMYYNFRWKYFGREDPVLYLEGGTDIWTLSGANLTYGDQMCKYNNPQANCGQYANVWNRVYDDINLANAVINRIGDVTYSNPTEKAVHEGEARWLRSYCYWWLVEFFGDIELRLEETSAPSFAAYRTPAVEIYDQVIIPDAELACQMLEVQPRKGLVGAYTRKAAYGLLARVCLTRAAYSPAGSAEQQAFYRKALEAAEYVINNKAALGIQLYNTYDEIWRADNNKTNSEYLAIVTHSSISSNNPNSGNPNRLHTYFTPAVIGRVGIAANNDDWFYYRENGFTMMPTKYFVQLFAEGDARYDAIFTEKFYANNDFEWTEDSGDLALFKRDFASITNKKVNKGDLALWFTREKVDPAVKASASYAVVDIDDLYDPVTGKLKDAVDASSQIIKSFPRFTKYRISDPDSNVKLCTSPSAQVGFADVPIMRYAEMPLIAAEACIGLGETGRAADFINNEIRTSRVVKPGYEAAMRVSAADMTVEFILDERARELCGEWLRWFDLKRTGKLVQYVREHNPDTGNNIKEHHVLRPIPKTFLDKLTNPEEFGQNPGYDPYVKN